MMKNYPNFEPLYNEVLEYVSQHQGEKGYIVTDPKHKDTMHAMVWDDIAEVYSEQIIYGVRVEEFFDGQKDLQVLPRVRMRTYDNAPTDEEYADGENWYSVKFSDCCLYLPTLLDLAEFVEEYE